MDPSGGNVTRVTHDDAVVASPAWSPDGTQLVIERYPDADVNSADIYRIGLDGSGLDVVSANPADERGPTWGVVPVPQTNVGITELRALLTYTEEGLETKTPVPVSASGAAYWIEAALNGPATRDNRYLGRIQDEETVYSLQTGEYEVLVGYGPKTTTSGGAGPGKKQSVEGIALHYPPLSSSAPAETCGRTRRRRSRWSWRAHWESSRA
jgi:hypothetical protein